MSRNFTKETILNRLEGAVINENVFEEQSAVEDENVAPEQSEGERVALFAGSFKPPHYGHLSVVRHLSNMDVDRVVVLISDPKKNKRSEVITPQAARDVFEMYASVDEGIKSPVEFEVSPTPSPITAVYGFIAEAKEGDKVIIATSEKDAKRYNEERMNKWSKENGNGAEVIVGIIPAVKVANPETGEEMNMSASHMRAVLDKYPNISEEEREKVYGYMHPNMDEQMKEEAFKKLAGPETVEKGMELVDKLVEQILSEEMKKRGIKFRIVPDELEEMSTMAGGAVSGFAAPLSKKKKRSQQTN